MPDYKYYLVRIWPPVGTKQQAIESILNRAKDWYRFENNSYIIYTGLNADAWSERLRPLLGQSGYVFVIKTDKTDSQGWMPGEFWEWLNRNRTHEDRPGE